MVPSLSWKVYVSTAVQEVPMQSLLDLDKNSLWAKENSSLIEKIGLPSCFSN